MAAFEDMTDEGLSALHGTLAIDARYDPEARERLHELEQVIARRRATKEGGR